MKLLFLGTGAPEGNPSPFCNCSNCAYVRRKQGKNIRFQASVLINDDLLIDFGPDITREFNSQALSMSKLKYVLITHCHFDHFFPQNFFFRQIGPRTKHISDLHIYGPNRIKKLSKEWLIYPDQQKVTLHSIKPFQKLSIRKYKINTFMITQNDTYAGKGMCFAISDGKTSILYAVDTYSFPERNWKAMSKFVFDVVILDETFGFKNPPNKDHHSIPLFLKTIERFRSEGMIHKKTKVFTQHMSHHNPPHDKLKKIMLEHKVIVPFDGLKVTC